MFEVQRDLRNSDVPGPLARIVDEDNGSSNGTNDPERSVNPRSNTEK